MLLLNLGFEVTWVGRRLPDSIALERPYRTHRFKLWFTKGAAFYASYNISLFFYLLFRKMDLIVSNDLDTLPACFFASRLKRINLVYDSHEYFLGTPEIQDRRFVKSVWQFLERLIFPRLNTVITVNNSIAELYEKDYGKKLHVVRNIGQPPHSIPVKERAALGLPPHATLLINQGSGMNIDRGVEEAVEAIKLVENAVLLLVGSGDVIPNIKAKVAREGLEKKVLFIDRVPYAELLSYTRLADIGLSLDKDTNINYRYSLPNKVFDYIHCGVPVLSSQVEEVKRVVEEYGVGLCVDNHKPTEIAQKIEMLRKMGKAAFSENLAKASRELTWEKEAEILEEIYRPLAFSARDKPQR